MKLYQEYIAFYSIVKKEVVRFLRIWPQTILPSVINQMLYFAVFGSLLGRQLQNYQEISYASFILPGLIMMAILSAAFSNVVSSFFGSKFQRSIEEILVSPMRSISIILGYCFGGQLRAFLIAAILLVTSSFFIPISIHSYFYLFGFAFFSSLLLSLAGLSNAIFAQKFDDTSIFATFILTPLSYFGGVFYSIDSLPLIWQNLSKLNPVFYLVDGFRYAFLGQSSGEPFIALLTSAFLCLIFLLLNLFLLEKGIKIRH